MKGEKEMAKIREALWEMDREHNCRCSWCLTPPPLTPDGADVFCSEFCPTCGSKMFLSKTKINTTLGAYDEIASDSDDSLKVTEKDGTLIIEWSDEK